MAHRVVVRKGVSDYLLGNSPDRPLQRGKPHGFFRGRINAANWPVCAHAFSKLWSDVSLGAVAKYGSWSAAVVPSRPLNTAVWKMSMLQYSRAPVCRKTIGG